MIVESLIYLLMKFAKRLNLLQNCCPKATNRRSSHLCMQVKTSWSTCRSSSLHLATIAWSLQSGCTRLYDQSILTSYLLSFKEVN
jgi:hypothetical protein